MTEADWIADFSERARAAGDADRSQLIALRRAAWRSWSRDPGRARALLEEGRALARRFGEPWWALAFQAWAVHLLVHYVRDFRQALDRAVAAALECRKPAYDGCPIRTTIYQDVLSVYYGTDPEGRADQIEEGFHAIDALGPGDFNSRLRQLNLRRWWAEQARQVERHYAAAQRALALVADDPKHSASVHYSMFIYNGLCRVHYARGEWAELGEAAALAGAASRRAGDPVELAVSLLWASLHAQHGGDAARAHRLRLQGARVMDGLAVPAPDGYFEALSACLERAGRPDEALAVRDRELALLQAQGRTISEVYCHSDRCRLLAAVGRLGASDLEAGRAAARALRFPAPHQARLDGIGR